MQKKKDVPGANMLVSSQFKNVECHSFVLPQWEKKQKERNSTFQFSYASCLVRMAPKMADMTSTLRNLMHSSPEQYCHEHYHNTEANYNTLLKQFQSVVTLFLQYNQHFYHNT